MEGAPCGGCAFGLVDLAQHGFCQSITPADDLEPCAALTETVSLQTQEGAQEPEDALHLGSRPAPVVGGKGIDREAPNTHIRCALHNALQGGHSGTMTGDAGETAPRCPAAIAVHDDGHMQASG